jgi:small subunit ribosomal protein S6
LLIQSRRCGTGRFFILRQYEAIIVYHPSLTEENLTSAVAKIEKKLKDAGASDISVAKWGLKKLNFRMKRSKKATEGHYMFIKFTSAGKVPNELKATLNVSEEIIRYSVVEAKPEAEAELPEVEIEPSMLAKPGEA